METIYGTENGQEFIGKLNDNFAECMTGSGGAISVKVPMQGGDLKSADGRVDGKWCDVSTPSVGTSVDSYFAGHYTDDDYTKYLHTPCYLSLIGNKVKSVTMPSGSTLTIFCYDDTFTLISGGVVSSADNIPDGAAYVKMQAYNANGFAQVLPITLTLASAPKWVKNTDTALVPRFVNFECKPPKFFDDAACTIPHAAPTGAAADVDNTRYHDNGFVMLPPNYSPHGEPTKFIIWFSGDACMWFMAHNPFISRDSNGKVAASVYEKNFKYLCNMGYAVVSFGGYTSMWGNEYGATRPTWWIAKIKPSYIASLRAFYDYLLANYNFDARPYIAAKSAGGYMLIHSASTMPIPIRAAAGLSIGIDLCSTIRGQLLNSQKSWQKMMGNPDWNSFTLNSGGSSITQRANPNSSNTNEKNDGDLLMNHKELYRTLCPILANTEVSDYHGYFTAIMTADTEASSAMRAAMHKVCMVPTKLWCATKDTAVSFSAHELIVAMITRGGGVAELRSYTGDDGSHSTFDGADKAVPMTMQDGTVLNVPLGAVEMVEWFKRW